MESNINHPWQVTPREAIAIQQRLRGRIALRDDLGEVRRVAGIDIGFPRGQGTTRAAVAVLDFPTLDLVDQAVIEQPTRFPYVPGLLSFREVPAALAALERLATLPDLLLCDGQGYAHPRRFGIACHLGLLTGIPAIGVAKSRLIGNHATLAAHRSSHVPLVDGDEVIGAVLRTRTGIKPLYVSAGHRITLETALRYVLACTTRYRLPETTRAAHRLASGKSDAKCPV